MSNKPPEPDMMVGLNTQALARTFLLNVQRPIKGVPGTSTTLVDSSGKFKIVFPSELVPWADAGDVVLVTFGVSKTTIQPMTPQESLGNA